jgi:hypothetical protein
MKRFFHIITVLFCSQFFLNNVNLAQEWRQYKVYRPQTERYFVCDVNTSKYQYNHDSSIAWFVDRWFCVWNANTYIEEGREGQVNVASTSFDGKTWTEPVPVFSDPDHSVLPVPHQQSSQWQPNLIVVDNELWAIWSQVGGDAAGCYFSKLSHPTGKWVNKRVEFDGKIFPIIEGEEWRVFPTQNPCQLKSGRVLAPVTINGPPAADSPPGMNAGQKRNTVIYTDDGGETWHISPGTFQPTKTWAQWEPTVWEPEPAIMIGVTLMKEGLHLQKCWCGLKVLIKVKPGHPTNMYRWKPYCPGCMFYRQAVTGLL